MKAKHTPGPWVIYPETDGTEICAVDMVNGLPVRQIICHPLRGENWIANARLIAAAPELLAALKLAESKLVDMEGDLRRFGVDDCGAEVAILSARAAIAKAKGA